MGLFINQKGHSDVFKNDAAILERNQSHSTIDSLSKWKQEQQDARDALNRHISDLEQLLQQQKKSQSTQLTTIRNRLNELQDNDVRQAQFEKVITESLARQADENQVFHQMLADKHATDQELLIQLNTASEVTKEIAGRLENVTLEHERIAVKMNEQLAYQQQLSEQIVQQKDVQQVVISRLDNQEGVTEKIGRQLDHLRSVFYERTNFLTEKIENSYTLTASFLAKLLPNAEQPMTHFWLHQKPEEKQKNSD